MIKLLYALLLSLGIVDRAIGLDISHWQGDIDVTRMGDADTKFCIMKVSEGISHRDSRFPEYWNQLLGTPILKGIYHFWRPDDPVSQANLFYNTFRDVAGDEKPDLPPVLDFEINPYSGVIDDLYKFLVEVERGFGIRPMIYTSAGKWNALGGVNWAKNYKLWVANYTNDPEPKMPGDWDSWDFWQYTDRGDGTQFGTESTNVDVNRFKSTWSVLKQEYGNVDDPELPPEPEVVRALIGRVIATRGLKIRSGPSIYCNQVGILPYGANIEFVRIEVVNVNEVWVELRYGGWCALAYKGNVYISM